MFDFTYYTPTKILFGKHTEEQVGRVIKEAGGSRVLVHYGSSSAVRSGLLKKITDSLEKEGLFHTELGGVVPNPRLGKVREGIALAKNENIDFILAVGGGSVIDSCKAIGYGLAEPDKDVWELFEHKRQPEGCFPLGVVLTIAAAGSEMSDSCVITDEMTWQKRSCHSDSCRPRFAVMDPLLTMSLPDYQTMSGCTDIMMHTMERYFTADENRVLTDEIAEGLMRTVMDCAKILHKDPENYEARAEVMWASSLSHNGLTGCGNGGDDFATHKLEHEVGGMFDVTHGAGLAALWPSWARTVYPYVLPRFVRFAKNVMGVNAEGLTDEETALAGISRMEEFYHSIGMPVNMRELGVEPTEEQIDQMTDSCIRANGERIGRAGKLGRDEIRQIFMMAR